MILCLQPSSLIKCCLKENIKNISCLSCLNRKWLCISPPPQNSQSSVGRPRRGGVLDSRISLFIQTGYFSLATENTHLWTTSIQTLLQEGVLTRLWMTFVKVQATGTLKKGMLSRTMCSMPTPSAYVSHIPRLFITRVFGFTSLWATPTFIFTL